MPLTTGRAHNCAEKTSAGVTRIAFANRQEVTTTTVGVDKAFSAITMASGKVFYPISFFQETLKFNESIAFANNSRLVTSRFEGSWMGWTQADRKMLVDLYDQSPCGLVAIAELENGQVILVGINPEKPTVPDKYYLAMEGSEFESGAKLDDVMQNILKLVARSSEPATKFTPGWAGVPLT
ncbi:MAG: hypothetical protein ACRCVX_14860 [Shewanella sp.]